MQRRKLGGLCGRGVRRFEALSCKSGSEVWIPHSMTFRCPLHSRNRPANTQAEGSVPAPRLPLESGPTLRSCFDFSGKTTPSQSFPPKNNTGRDFRRAPEMKALGGSKPSPSQ